MLQPANARAAAEPLLGVYVSVGAKGSIILGGGKGTQPCHRSHSKDMGPLMVQSCNGTMNWHQQKTLCKGFCLPLHPLHPPVCLPQLLGLKVGRDVREWSHFQEDEEWKHVLVKVGVPLHSKFISLDF